MGWVGAVRGMNERDGYAPIDLTISWLGLASRQWILILNRKRQNRSQLRGDTAGEG